MDYLSSDQAKKYILFNFSLMILFCLFDLSNFQKTQVTEITLAMLQNTKMS